MERIDYRDARRLLNGETTPQKRPPAHTPGKMNRTEAAYALRLEARKRVGEIVDWRFEAVTLRIADAGRTNRSRRFTPDFLVVYPDGAIELVEVKGGYAREDAAQKFDVAASMYPCFRWRWAVKGKGGWAETVVG